MLTREELNLYLEEFLPSKGVTDYCPNGLQVEGKSAIKHLATAVSASLATIEAAIEQGIDALIVHHGLFWQRDSYVIDGVKRKKIALLLENNVSLFAYHLPLDAHMSVGNNWKAAIDLQWKDLQPFAYVNQLPIGVRGRIPPTPKEMFKQCLENYYQHPAVCAYGGPELIQTVALVSGGSYRTISDAIKAGVDAFITGNFDEPVWHQAMEEKIHFFAMGHSATERIGPLALAHHLEQKFQIPCSFIDIENPF